MITTLDLSGIQAYLPTEEIERAIRANIQVINRVLRGKVGGPADLGWFSPSRWTKHELVDQILSLAGRIRTDGEVFVLIGVGGSNRGAQSVIEPLGDRQVKIIYAGDNLSSQALKHTLEQIEGRSTYLNLIAKDFNTLEPGIAFRFLRQYMERVYGAAARERIIVTGSPGLGQLQAFSQDYGCACLPFPEDMGGRFSVISPVGLLPMAVAGVNIRQLIDGASAAEHELLAVDPVANLACQYATARNLLFNQGFVIENLVTLEPSLSYFGRWWLQLFAESEGKNQRCVFPIASAYSEDLHASGQYIQEGRRMIMETFIEARFSNPDLVIQPSQVDDGFRYLDHRPYDDLNAAVYQAAYTAHSQGGVPCFQFRCSELTPRTFGELFYIFMLSCCISAMLIEVNPFGQPGVEAYKRNMYRFLGKPSQEKRP